MRTSLGWTIAVIVVVVAVLSQFLAVGSRDVHVLSPGEIRSLNVDQISIGQGALEVRNALGAPITCKVHQDNEIWFYPRNLILMRSGKVLTVAGRDLFVNKDSVLTSGADRTIAEMVLSRLADPNNRHRALVPATSAVFFDGKTDALILREPRPLLVAIGVELECRTVTRIQLSDNGGFLMEKNERDGQAALHRWDSLQKFVQQAAPP